MSNKKDLWAQKWRQLKKLVNKKYESYIAVMGLELRQFQELEGTQVKLLVKKCSFCIGHGSSRLTAINMALQNLKNNKIFDIMVFTDKVASRKEASEAKKILKECESESAV